MQTYEQLQEVASRYRETNDCTVRGIATLFGCTYGVAHRALAKNGRKHRQGARWSTLDKALTQLAERFGVTLEERGMPQARLQWARYNGIETQTIARFVKSNPKGSYLLSMNGHVAAVRDGVLYDWTAKTAQRRQVVGYIKINEEG